MSPNTVRSPSNFIGKGVFTDLFENDRLITTLKNYIQIKCCSYSRTLYSIHQNKVMARAGGIGPPISTLHFKQAIGSERSPLLLTISLQTMELLGSWQEAIKQRISPLKNTLLNAEQIFVPAGNFLVLDAMLFHCQEQIKQTAHALE